MAEYSKSSFHHSEQFASRLASAYREGKQNEGHCALATKETLDRASSYTRARLTSFEQVLANRCYQVCKKSRTIASGVDSPMSDVEACQNLAIANSLAVNPGLSEEARLICLSEIYPAEAFVEHQYESPRKARWFMEKSMATDQILEDRFGYEMKIAHRLYSASFSIAILFQQDETLEAARRSAQLLQLLAGVSEPISEPGDWSQERIDRLPQGMREFHAIQTIHVFYSFVATLDFEERQLAVCTFLACLGGAFMDRLESSDESSWTALHPCSLIDLMAGAANPELLEESNCFSRCIDVITRLRPGGLLVAVTLDLVSVLLESGHQAPEALDLLDHIRQDLCDLVQSRIVRTRQRSHIARLSITAANKGLSRQPQFGCLAVSA